MSMNQFLAEAYGTRENIGAYDSDTEKLAQAEILGDILADEGIAIDDLSADTISKVATAMFGEGAELTKAAQEVAEEEKKEEKPKEKKEEEPEESEKKAAADADYLGRLMAHAYVDELSGIEKEADFRAEWAKRVAKGGPGVIAKAKEVGGKALGALKKRYGPVAEAAKKWTPPGRSGGQVGRTTKERILGTLGAIPKAELAGVAGVGAGVGAGKALGGKKKKSEAEWFENMAAERAVEMLKEAGVELEAQPEDKTDEEKLAEALDQRAYELLVENGWIEE